MEGVLITLGESAIIGFCFLMWMQHTRSGKTWFENL